MSETVLFLIFFGPLLFAGTLLILIKSFRFFMARRITKTLEYLENGPATPFEIAEHFDAPEYLVNDALARMLCYGLVAEQIRSCWGHEGESQRPVTVYSLTHAGRRILGSENQIDAILQNLRS